MAGVIANDGSFDLDHLSTKIGEDLRTPGASQHPAKVKHTYAIEWACHGLFPQKQGDVLAYVSVYSLLLGLGENRP